MSRRLNHGLEKKDLPDLIVLDGGKMQLAAGLQALKDLGVPEVEMVALAKKREIGAAGPHGELARPRNAFTCKAGESRSCCPRTLRSS